jgi:hypothetical protein
MLKKDDFIAWERDMLRLILLALAIGVVVASTPALSQNFKGSCSAFCQKERCAHGSMNQAKCMTKCVQICKEKNPKATD